MSHNGINQTIRIRNDCPVVYGTAKYTGPYQLCPTTKEQRLDTAQKSLVCDLVVQPIPYRTEVNSAGGITVFIAGGEDHGN